MIRVGILLLLFATAALADERRPGSAYMGDALRAMEQDDAANPAMLWVSEGEALWSAKAGAANKACADCHGATDNVAARYPAYAADAGQVVNLDQRVDLCRVRYQQAPPFGFESRSLLALTALLARQARATLITPSDDPRVAGIAATGRALYFERQGQLNLSCANCHDDHAGGRLGGAVIPQAHPTGYPIYRLEWGGVGSLQRRLRGCLAGVRAPTPAFGDPKLLALEAYLMARAAGMAMDAPAVRP